MPEPTGAGGASAPPIIIIELAGAPRGKGALRHRVIAPRDGPAFATGYQDAATRAYEGNLRKAAMVAMRGLKPLTGALICVIRAYMPIPASWPKRDRALAIAGQIRPTGKFDWDNLGKAAGDSLKGIVWLDDAQVVDGRVFKYYSLNPALLIEVRPWRFGQNE